MCVVCVDGWCRVNFLCFEHKENLAMANYQEKVFELSSDKYVKANNYVLQLRFCGQSYYTMEPLNNGDFGSSLFWCNLLLL